MKLLFTLVSFLFTYSCIFSQTSDEGMKALDNEQYQKARQILLSQYKQTPTAQSAFFLGYYFLKVSKPDSAKLYFTKGVSLDATNQINQVGLGHVSAAKGDLSGAKVLIDQAVTTTKSKNYQILVKSAEAYMSYEKKNLDEAIRLLTIAAALKDATYEANMLLGDAYYQKKDGSNASLNYDRALYKNNTLAKLHIKAATLLINAKNYNGALEKFKEGLKIDPNYAPGYREIADLYYLAKKYPEAVENFKKYIEMTDFDPNKQFRYAGYLYLNKQYAESLTELKKVEKTVTNVALYRLLGFTHLETGNPQAAKDYMNTFFSKATKDDIISSDYENFGKIYLALGNDSLAILQYRKAMEIDTVKSNLQKEIASIYFKSKKYPEAVKEYEALIKMTSQPGAQEYMDLGRAYYSANEVEKADTTFSKVIELSPATPYAYIYKARAKAKLDPETSLGLAKPYYQKFTELATDVSKFKSMLIEAHSYLGYYYYLQKNLPTAHENWNKVLAIDPNNEQAKEGLKFNR